jgi:hypothetical protein
MEQHEVTVTQGGGDPVSARAARCGNDPRGEFARPFNVTTAEGEVYHGVEFPVTGLVVLASPEQGLVAAHASVETLLAYPDMQDAIIERPEETT